MIALLVAALPSFCANNAARPVKILVLWFGDRDNVALPQFEGGLRTSLERGLDAPVWIYDESFDQAWLGQDSPYGQVLESLLNDKYAGRGIDIVVAIGNYPLQYLQQRRKTLLPGAKLMYVVWQSPRPPVPDSTGVVWDLDLAPTLEIALDQNPGTHHVLLVAGASAPDRAMAQLLLSSGQKYLQQKHRDFDLQILPPQTVQETVSTLAALPKDTITVITTYMADSAGQGFVTARMLRVFSAATNRPMYGWVNTYMSRGIVGGSLINVEAMGAALGDMALRVLHGEQPGTIPEVRAAIRQNMIDWRQLKRWGIGMDKVPPDSIVINREYTFWELYKWRLIAVIGLILLQTLLVLSLVRSSVAQTRDARQLERQRELEELLAQVAAAFINLPAQLVNLEIEKSLQRLLEFFQLDRTGLFEFSGPTAQLRLLAFRGAPDVDRPPAVFDLRQLPWTVAQLLQGKPIVVSRLNDLPEEATELRKLLKDQGIRSFATFPLQRAGKTFATLSFSTIHNEREWPLDVVQSLGTVADILGSALERKSAEQAAAASRERLTGIIDSAMDAIIAVDNRQQIVVFNTTAEKMFGCSSEEALGQPIERFIPNRFRSQHSEHISYFGGTGTTNRAMGALGALLALRANGEEFPIEASISQVTTDQGKVFTVVIRDIAERNRVEQQLRDSNRLNATILESLNNRVAVLDPKGTIIAATAAGPEFRAVKGINRLNLGVGGNYFEICKAAAAAGDPDVSAALAGVQAIYLGMQKSFELEYDYGAGGDQRWFSMSVTPLQTTAGGVVISHEDITLRKRHEQAIQELGGRLINAQEQERSRIARELHDDINQQVAMLAIELQQLQDVLPKDAAAASNKIHALWKKTHELSMDIQHLSHQLHSTKLEHLGIVAALRSLCNEFSEQNTIEVLFQFKEVPPIVSHDVALSLFRVAQESLHNVAKHSRARNVRVELVGKNGGVVLRVSDDGVGFDPESVEYSTGLGMISMRERIRLIGGTLTVRSGHSLGTQIEAVILLSREKAAAEGASASAFTSRKVG